MISKGTNNYRLFDAKGHDFFMNYEMLLPFPKLPNIEKLLNQNNETNQKLPRNRKHGPSKKKKFHNKKGSNMHRLNPKNNEMDLILYIP